MIPSFVEKTRVPKKPGVYIFKDKTGRVLYVGKAINLYNRVSSYFSHVKSGKISSLVDQISAAETITCESELEALILEANFIKKYLPPFNVRLVDDKDYLYIVITKEDFPKVITARKKELEGAEKYWGPFPSARTVRDTLKSLRRIFPWCSQKKLFAVSRSLLAANSQKLIANSYKPCFYYHLGLCPGACMGLISEKDYNRIISRFSKFIDGKKEQLLSDLTKEMMQASGKQKFEDAARIKKTINGILYMTQPQRTNLYLENRNFLEEERELALKTLQKDLNLKTLPQRIEGYDISNISGKEATGSLVVLTNGEIDKSQYRKFKIHITGRPNDVGMHKEMLIRRLNHPEWPMHDLIIVDGGRSQAKAMQSILHTTSYIIPIFGLAKRMEWLYPPEGEIIKLPKRSLSLKLLQKLRDESHRFALSYHRKLRDKIMIG